MNAERSNHASAPRLQIMLGASRAQGNIMAYRNSYNYKGGSKKVRDSRRVKRGLRIAGWVALWLFVGMLVTHLIISVASKSKRELAELASEGIPPITTRRDEVNAQCVAACWCGGSFTDSYATDLLISTLKRKGITEAVLDIKPESGMLAYSSDVTAAKRADAVPEGAPELDRIIVKFKNAGIGVVARLSLYIDDAAATDLKHCAVESREVTTTETDEEGNVTTVVRNEKVDALWKDDNGHAWRSPFDSGAVEYARDLLLELAEGGVDAVLIDNVRFPNAADGDEGSVIFPEEASAEIPRAGAIRQNISLLYSAARSAGIKLYVALDAPYCCGTQDERAGITFNAFGLDADVICPIAIVSRFEEGAYIGAYAFPGAAEADTAQFFEAVCSGIRMMQGAVDEPPAVMVFVQAYSDVEAGVIMTAGSLKTQTDALDKNLIPGRVFYGTGADFEALLPDASAPEPEPETDAETETDSSTESDSGASEEETPED